MSPSHVFARLCAADAQILAAHSEVTAGGEDTAFSHSASLALQEMHAHPSQVRVHKCSAHWHECVNAFGAIERAL